MDTRWGGHYMLPMLILFWGYYQLSRINVPLVDVEPETLYPLMKEKICKFHVYVEEGYFLSVYGLLVKQSGWFLMKEKLKSVFSISNFDTVVNWLLSQMFTLHFFEEVIACDKFLITIVVLALVNIGIYSLSSDPLVPIKIDEKPRGHQQELRLIPEKFIILTSVIVRTPDSILREKNFAFNRMNGANNCLITDVTIFAMWFALQASISLAVRRLTNRLEEAIVPGKYCFNQWLTPSFVKITFLLFALLGTSFSAVTFSISTFRLVHPLYGCVFTIEAVELLIKTINCLSLYLYSLANKEHKNTRGSGPLSAGIVINHFVSIIRYILYIWIGGFVNNRILPLCFITPARYHFYGFIDAIRRSTSQETNCDNAPLKK